MHIWNFGAIQIILVPGTVLYISYLRYYYFGKDEILQKLSFYVTYTTCTYENKKIKRMKANFEQSANSSTTRLHERLYGTGSLSERKNYGLLKMKAQKRHKSIKRKHCGDGGSFTLACSTTYKVIEELLSIPIRWNAKTARELLLKYTVMLRKFVWNLMRGKNKILEHF
ncbi:unknown protein [Bathycoccus prasinos]|uniref:Uncharacterized protein n=1 Tax=Bathycoccus prasinos TaxID=41875 RepID=K8F4L1_9CHLO|nr:unknown protein [Bathycoccus prasinos]CCO19760.1 unknown protein [Bathycoccus prasinos]|eukprot:XP_007509303.1 unknown protein [Bathycoccus prasinos]